MKLTKSICKKCKIDYVKDEKIPIIKRVFGWTKSADIDWDEFGIVLCPYRENEAMGLEINTENDSPPKSCPFFLEHVVKNAE